MKTHLRLLTLAVLILLLLGGFQSSVAGRAAGNGAALDAQLSDPALQSVEADLQPEDKIEPLLNKQLAADGQADFFVWMTEKADLNPANSLLNKQDKSRFVFEVLRQTASTSQRDLRGMLDSLGVQYRAFYIANKVLVRDGTLRLALDLAARPDVARITANHTYQLEEPRVSPKPLASPTTVEGNISFVNADDAWALGFTGQGTVLASIDTGLDWQHPAILNQYRGWNGVSADHNYNWWDSTGTYPTAPGDGFGHGTHVTGTMIGDDGGTNQIGMAPGAKTVHCKGLDDFGGGDDSTLSECFEFFLAPWDLNGSNPDPAMAPDAITNSWGYWNGGYPVFEDEIAALQAAGVLVEVSAGNEGPSCQTLRSPGDYSGVLTTGSVGWFSGTLPGSLTWFSSRGPSTLSPEYLPNIMAPGESVRSALPGGGYESWDGTSMAGPHVTGLVGLLWAANPGLKGLIPETHQIIQLTAIPLSGQTGSNCGGDYDVGPNHDWGYGTIDALAAVEAALLFGGPGTLAGTVTESAGSLPLENALIKAALAPNLVWQTTTDAAGAYSRVVFSGTYTVTASLYGYFPAELAGVQVIEGQTTTLDIQLDPAPFYLVNGTVTDAVTGWPLYARIDILGYPFGPVWTDPLTGQYSLSLAAGVPYTFKVSPFVPGYQPAFRAVGPLGGPQGEDFALFADMLACQAPGYLPEFVYFEDFESDDGGYTVEGGFSSWEWGAPTSGPRSAHSGQYAWATNLSGNYFDNEFGFLTSPNIDMSAYAPAGGGGGGGGQAAIILSWWQWLETETYRDFAWVEASNDGGASWSIVYGPVDGKVDTTWTKHTIPLDASYAVSNMRVRFVLQSDFIFGAPGFYVDDVGVGAVVQPPTLYSQDFEADDGGFAPSGVNSWQWGTPTRGPSGAHSGLNVWATALADNYGNNEDGWLTSPVIDLSAGAGEPLLISWWAWLQTESGFDFASVEVTADGLSWSEIFNASGIITTDWFPYAVELDPAFATMDFQVRFHLQSDGSVTYPGFYLDDLKVSIFSDAPPAVGCDPQAGGLVVGNVYDQNTGAGLAGAAVSSSAATAFSQAIPLDPAVEDGFYTVFALAGTQPLTATLQSYGPDHQSPLVVQGGAVWQDFSLPAGLLAASPGSLDATLDMGQSATLNFDLENSGNQAATFQLREKPGSFTPALGLDPVTVPGYQPALADSAATYAGQHPEQPLAARDPFAYQPPTGARLSSLSVDVLLVAAADVNGIQAILQSYPDLSVVDIFDARSATPSLDQLQAYDSVVVISNNPFLDPVALGDVLADYVDAGGTVVQTVPTFYDPPGIGWGLQGRFVDEGYSPFIGTGDWFLWADLGAFDAAHPIMDGVSFASDYYRQVVDLAPGADWVASWTDDEFIAVTDSVVALNTFLPDGWAWSGDIPLILHNSILWLQTAGDLAWLATDPSEGSVSALGSETITVTLDASVPEIAQPGAYTAAIRVVDDSPYTADEVQVTMNVNPPLGWGKLSGAVTGLGYCDAPGGPLAKASVDIQGVAAVESDPSGLYSYWMPAGAYQVIVSASGYISQTLDVSISAGQVSVQDVSLRLDAPCTSVSPQSFNLTISQGQTDTQIFSIENTGAGSYSTSFFESLFEFPAPAQRELPLPAGWTAAAPASGPASLLSIADRAQSGDGAVLPASGWFGALDHPEGLVRYAFAQCYEQPDSYYLFGGVNGSFSLSSKAWRYDASTNTWSQLASMPAGYESPSAACYQGKIYVLGGSGTADLFIYSIASNSWSLGAALPRGVGGAAAAAWDGKVFLVGGDDDFSPWTGVSDQVNVYDIASNTWIGNGASMPEATGHAGYVQQGPYLYVVGGWGLSAPDFNTSATQRYDLAADQWELGPIMASPRADLALAATDGALYAMGGDQDGNWLFEATNTFERLSLSDWPNGAWEDTSDPLPLKITANNAGFCTQALMDGGTAEIWSVGGLDTQWWLIHGRALFQERAAETCYSIYSDVPWLSLGGSDPGGTLEIPGGVSVPFELFVDTGSLALGQHKATLVFAGNDPGVPQVVIPVTVTVVDQIYRQYFPMISR